MDMTASPFVRSALGAGVGLQDVAQGRHGAGAGADDDGVLAAGLVQGVLDHLVGDGVGEHDQQVGVAQPVFQRPSHLGDDFGRTLVRTAEIFILADHALVSA